MYLLGRLGGLICTYLLFTKVVKSFVKHSELLMTKPPKKLLNQNCTRFSCNQNACFLVHDAMTCHISQIGLILNLNFRTDLQMFDTELRDKFRNYKGESVLEIFAVCIPMLENALITLLASFFYTSPSILRRLLS